MYITTRSEDKFNNDLNWIDMYGYIFLLDHAIRLYFNLLLLWHPYLWQP